MNPRLRRALQIAGYALFYVFALFVFAYLTFPYERLKDRLLQEFNQHQTGPEAMRLELDELDSYWLSGVEAKGIRLISRPKPQAVSANDGTPVNDKPLVMTVDSAHARVALLGLLIGNINLSFAADAFGGELVGYTSESDGARNIEVELEDLDLSRAPVLASAVGLPLFGTINGELAFLLPEGKLGKADGTLSLKISGLAVGDGKAKIRDAIALPKVEAGDLNLAGESTAGQLKITNFAANGPDLELAAEGSARLRDPLPASLLNLTARFRFTERYTNKNEMTRALFGAKGSSMPGLFDLDQKNKRAKRADGFYGWRVSGPLNQPTFTPYPTGASTPTGKVLR